MSHAIGSRAHFDAKTLSSWARRPGRQALFIAGAWLVFVLVPDLLVRAPSFAQRGPAWLVLLALATVASLGVWQSIGALFSLVRPVHPRLAALVALGVALVFGTATGGTLGYHAHFALDPGPEVWEFCLENPRYALALTAASAGTLQLVHLMGGPCLLAGLLIGLTDVPRVRRPPRVHWVAVGLLPLAVAVAPLPLAGRLPMPADFAGLRTIVLGTYRYALGGELRVLPAPKRARLAATPARATPDVIVLLQESLSAAWEPAAGVALPGHEEHTVRFSRATATSNATAVAVPTLFTGVSPDASREEFARAPTLWQWARSHGYQSALFSAQEYDYYHFRRFLLDDGAPDVVRVATDFEPAVWVNDLGIEDSLVVDAAIELLQRTPRERPLFLIVQLNATHWPCWAPGIRAERLFRANEASDLDERRRRCRAAASYVREQAARVVEALERAGRLTQSFVIETSDHGESFRAERPRRTASMFEEVLRVPLAMHVPDALQDRLGALRENADRRVSNLDIAATLLDVWGDWPLGPGAPRLGGLSLLRPIAPDRELFVTSDSAILDWNPACALYRGEQKWMRDAERRVRLFDLADDPGETRDLSPTVGAANRAGFDGALGRHRGVRP